jgi:DNA-binding beta-propeller fold protein YncE
MRSRSPQIGGGLCDALYAFLIAIAALRALPRNAQAQLYVANRPVGTTGVVSEYNATTGAVINATLIAGLNAPTYLAVKGNTLFVSNFDANAVGKYDATTGGAINPGFITPLFFLEGLAVKGNKLFVANNFNTVGEYNAKTGGAINANFITGLTVPFGLAVKSAK